ncbi:MAG: 50S ribosomal protein L22 [Proteobacteria bacterium]|nr:50S ribosomal protein L22 [Pseudomonadota bacterium]
MEVKAVAKHVRISPQKVRKIVGAIKGNRVEKGLNALRFMPQKASGIVEKVLKSAVANANHNNDLDVDSLIVKNILVDSGPTLKRFRPRARGRGSRILKRTSHITVIVADQA